MERSRVLRAAKPGALSSSFCESALRSFTQAMGFSPVTSSSQRYGSSSLSGGGGGAATGTGLIAGGGAGVAVVDAVHDNRARPQTAREVRMAGTSARAP